MITGDRDVFPLECTIFWEPRYFAFGRHRDRPILVTAHAAMLVGYKGYPVGEFQVLVNSE